MFIYISRGTNGSVGGVSFSDLNGRGYGMVVFSVNTGEGNMMHKKPIRFHFTGKDFSSRECIIPYSPHNQNYVGGFSGSWCHAQTQGP